LWVTVKVTVEWVASIRQFPVAGTEAGVVMLMNVLPIDRG
jgi:hypothetical protein